MPVVEIREVGVPYRHRNPETLQPVYPRQDHLMATISSHKKHGQPALDVPQGVGWVWRRLLAAHAIGAIRWFDNESHIMELRYAHGRTTDADRLVLAEAYVEAYGDGS